MPRTRAWNFKGERMSLCAHAPDKPREIKKLFVSPLRFSRQRHYVVPLLQRRLLNARWIVVKRRCKGKFVRSRGNSGVPRRRCGSTAQKILEQTEEKQRRIYREEDLRSRWISRRSPWNPPQRTSARVLLLKFCCESIVRCLSYSRFKIFHSLFSGHGKPFLLSIKHSIQIHSNYSLCNHKRSNVSTNNSD